MLDSEIYYHDLKESLEVLKREEESPLLVRKELRTFASLVETLHDVMRGEFARLGLGDLPVPPLEEWGPVVAVFHELRRLTQHQLAAAVRVRERVAFDASRVPGQPSRRLAVLSESEELGPFDTDLGRGVQMEVGVPTAGQSGRVVLPVVRRLRTFILVAPSPQVEAALAKVGIDAIDILCGLCFSAVDHQYQVFRGLIADADLSKMKPLASGGRRRRHRARKESTQTTPSRGRQDP